jgi:hypothetical protein
MSKLPPDDSAAGLRRRLTAALQPDRRVPTVPIIGRGCITDAGFSRTIAQSLGLPTLTALPDETEGAFLVRRLNQIKFVSRYWANTSLESLAPEWLTLAAMQICDAGANYAQDRICERVMREKQA